MFCFALCLFVMFLSHRHWTVYNTRFWKFLLERSPLAKRRNFIRHCATNVKMKSLSKKWAIWLHPVKWSTRRLDAWLQTIWPINFVDSLQFGMLIIWSEEYFGKSGLFIDLNLDSAIRCCDYWILLWSFFVFAIVFSFVLKIIFLLLLSCSLCEIRCVVVFGYLLGQHVAVSSYL